MGYVKPARSLHKRRERGASAQCRHSSAIVACREKMEDPHWLTLYFSQIFFCTLVVFKEQVTVNASWFCLYNLKSVRTSGFSRTLKNEQLTTKCSRSSEQCNTGGKSHFGPFIATTWMSLCDIQPHYWRNI